MPYWWCCLFCGEAGNRFLAAQIRTFSTSRTSAAIEILNILNMQHQNQCKRGRAKLIQQLLLEYKGPSKLYINDDGNNEFLLTSDVI